MREWHLRWPWIFAAPIFIGSLDSHAFSGARRPAMDSHAAMHSRDTRRPARVRARRCCNTRLTTPKTQHGGWHLAFVAALHVNININILCPAHAQSSRLPLGPRLAASRATQYPPNAINRESDHESDPQPYAPLTSSCVAIYSLASS